MQHMEKIVCKRIVGGTGVHERGDCRFGGLSFSYEEGPGNDVPDFLIRKSSTICTSRSAAEGDERFTVFAPRGSIRTWIDCVAKLYMNAREADGDDHLRAAGGGRMVAYLEVRNSV